MKNAAHQIYGSALDDLINQQNRLFDKFECFHDEIFSKKDSELTSTDVMRINQRLYDFFNEYSFLETLSERVSYLKKEYDNELEEKFKGKEDISTVLFDLINNKIGQIDVVIEMLQLRKYPLLKFGEVAEEYANPLIEPNPLIYA